MTTDRQLDELCVNALRFLAVDAVEEAGSGHPGMPLGAAPMAYVLWDRFLRHNPRDPGWFDRDRFILSAGHGSALLYALLHLSGYDLSLDEIRDFRQYGSATPGHPEYGDTPGVEATTGPLGQGFGMGLGMALTERFLAGCFNDGIELVDHHTYAIVSDGDLMEGISAEAASLAGELGLGKLVYLYDDNHISIEGATDLAFTEDVRRRFEAHHWQVLTVRDGNDLEAIEAAIRLARAEPHKPSLILVRTLIGYGSPQQDSPEAHGSPLGEEGVRSTKEALGWPTEPAFHVPDAALEHFREALERGEAAESEWKARLDEYRDTRPELAERFEREISGDLPAGWTDGWKGFVPGDGPMATRKASGTVMNQIAERVPNLIGGSADLAPSTKTTLVGYGDYGFDEGCPRNIHFGVREHAMGAVANGMALHGGVFPYTGTFLVFSDYMRPALRLAALMQTRVVFIFTHDSIGLGEDGPTHQPVEHLMSLRGIPGLTVIRPADANETAAAWRLAMERDGPVVLVFSRQGLPVLDPERFPTRGGVSKGGYVLADAGDGPPDVVLIGTGSEVHLALSARQQLTDEGIEARVVSLPSWEVWEEQSQEYRDEVLPVGTPRVAVEAGVTRGWRELVGDSGAVIGIDRFGASGPGEVVYADLGFSVDRIVQTVRHLAAA